MENIEYVKEDETTLKIIKTITDVKEESVSLTALKLDLQSIKDKKQAFIDSNKPTEDNFDDQIAKAEALIATAEGLGIKE